MPLVQFPDSIASAKTVVLPASFSFDQQAAFLALMHGSGEDVRTWILDFREVTRIDSSGLGLLVSLRDFADKHQQDVILRNPSEHVRETLIRANFHTLFTLE